MKDFKSRLRKWMLMLTTATVSVAFCFSNASAANGLVNGGFEQTQGFGSPDLGPGWSYIQSQFTFGSDHLIVNPIPSCHNGSKCAAIMAGEGENKSGSIIQTIHLTSGTYNITISGWTWQYESDTTHNAAWVRADLYTEPSDHIVGDPGWVGDIGTATNDPQLNGAGWMHITNTFSNIIVQGDISLLITQRANGYGNTGHAAALSDDWSLKVKRVK